MKIKNLLFLPIILIAYQIAICQTFAIDIDDIANQWERPSSLNIEGDNLYVTCGSVCEDSLTFCGTVNSFTLDGDHNWLTRIEDFQIANQKETTIDQDTLYITSHAGRAGEDRVVKLSVIDINTGEEVGRYESPISDEMEYLITNGHFIHNNLIYVYGNGSHVNDSADKPGYIHVMDKKGNRIDEIFIRFEALTVIRNVSIGDDGNYYLSVFGDVFGEFTRYNYIIKFHPTTLDYEIIWSDQSSQSQPYLTTTPYGFVIAGEVDGSYITRSLRGISYTGEPLWEKEYETNVGTEGWHTINNIITTRNGNLLLASTFEETDGNKAMITRMTDWGNIIWEKVYPTYAEDGSGIPYSGCSAAEEIEDGSIVAIGSYRNTRIIDDNYMSNGRLFKIGPDGCFDDQECDDDVFYEFFTDTDDIDNTLSQAITLTLSPNPASTHLTLTASSEINKVIVRNHLGREVKTVTDNYSPITTLSISELPFGIYSVSCWVNSYGWVTEKVVIK